MQPGFGFREQAHTADWELEVWAPDLAALLEQAAHGMYAISGVQLEADARHSRTITLQAADAESLLVQFLSELLWIEQDQHLAFDQIALSIDDGCRLSAKLDGSRIAKLDKEIKAVTYHNLAVEVTSAGMRVHIVFDV